MSQQWLRAGNRADFIDGMFGVEIDGTPVAVYDVDGEIYATDDVCTHGWARLSDGYFEDGYIECPLHQGRFDVKTGAAISLPCTEDIRSFPVKMDGDEIFVAIEDDAK